MVQVSRLIPAVKGGTLAKSLVQAAWQIMSKRALQKTLTQP